MLHTDPFALLSSLEREVGRVAGDSARRGWLPAADVIVRDDEVKVYMDAPGVHEEDLTIEVQNGLLTIEGHRRPLDVAGSSAQRIERGWGRWSRTIRLHDGLDADRVAAELDEGVLTITIPLADVAKPRRVAIGRRGPVALEPAED